MIPKNRFIWLLLALQGGFINIGGLLTVHLFVSHVTGFAAHFSVALSLGQMLKSLYFVLVPIFFLLGAVFSSLFTEVQREKNISPKYYVTMFVLFLIYMTVSIGGEFGVLGVFGEPFINIRDFILLILLSFSCGCQNALVTHYSRSIIRTTHLTGITTDLGIGIAKFFVSRNSNEGKLNRIRLEIIISFVLGSLLGSLIFPKYKFLSFLFPAVISGFIGIKLYLNYEKV